MKTEMKLIVAGSRRFTDYEFVKRAIEQWWFDHGRPKLEIVSGAADGVDTLAARFGRKTGFPVKFFHADWDEYEKSAGPIRNRQMAEYADALLAIPMGVSSGTRDMIVAANEAGLEVEVVEVDDVG